ncbi:MAG: hypothetical protein R6V05_12125, partial [Candidatus Brocadiia bacterium]
LFQLPTSAKGNSYVVSPEVVRGEQPLIEVRKRKGARHGRCVVTRRTAGVARPPSAGGCSSFQRPPTCACAPPVAQNAPPGYKG